MAQNLMSVAGTSDAVAVDAAAAFAAVVAAMPAVLARLDSMGITPKLMSPEEFAAFTRSEKERWGKIIRRANIKVE